MYVLNNIDRVFKLSVTSSPVKPSECAHIRAVFIPKIPLQSYTEYYMVDDTAGNIYRLTVSGRCYG